MKTLLITGGAGFIGSNFVHYALQNHPYRLVNLDLLTYAGNLENLRDVEDDDRHVFIRGDIRDRTLLGQLFADFEFDAVVNFAAESYVDRSITDPEIFLKTNVLGTQTLLDVARESWRTEPANPRCRDYRPGVRFVQVSAAEVYGDLSADELFDEASPLLPTSPYAASKAGADLLVQAYHEAYGLPTNITRCSSNYGPFQFPEKLIPAVIASAVTSTRIPVYGDGQQVRDWLHVADHCRAIDAVMHDGQPGELYNIGGDSAKTNLDVIRYVLAQLEASEDLIEPVADRHGHGRRLVVDNRKIQTELNWSPTFTFESGIQQTIDWYRNNPEWLRGVNSGAYEEYYRLYYSVRPGSAG